VKLIVDGMNADLLILLKEVIDTYEVNDNSELNSILSYMEDATNLLTREDIKNDILSFLKDNK